MKVVRVVRIAALLLCLLLLLAGFGLALLHPATKNYYENRPAVRIGSLSASGFLDQSFQETMEDALADQVPAATKMKKLYNILDASLSLPAAQKLAAEGRYAGYRDIFFFRDMMVLKPLMLDELKDRLDVAKNRILDWTASSPDASFYLFYIESYKDIDLETGEKSGFYEYLTDGLSLPAGHTARLAVNSYEDFSRYFLATDHHWKEEGSYRGYLEICSMLGKTPLETDGVYTDHGRFLGSRAAGIEGLKPGDFSVILYRYPPMTISASDAVLEDYGQQSRFIAGELPGVSYSAVYGEDLAEIHFVCAGGQGNALILGDSYDNAVVKALAAGFANTWSIDLRAYRNPGGIRFDLPAYAAGHEIDTVILIGGVDFYCSILPLSGSID